MDTGANLCLSLLLIVTSSSSYGSFGHESSLGKGTRADVGLRSNLLYCSAVWKEDCNVMWCSKGGNAFRRCLLQREEAGLFPKRTTVHGRLPLGMMSFSQTALSNSGDIDLQGPCCTAHCASGDLWVWATFSPVPLLYCPPGSSLGTKTAAGEDEWSTSSVLVYVDAQGWRTGGKGSTMLFTWTVNHSWVKVSHSTLLQESNRKQRSESSSIKFCAIVGHIMFSVQASVVLTPVSHSWNCLFQLWGRQIPALQLSLCLVGGRGGVLVPRWLWDSAVPRGDAMVIRVMPGLAHRWRGKGLSLTSGVCAGSASQGTQRGVPWAKHLLYANLALQMELPCRQHLLQDTRVQIWFFPAPGISTQSHLQESTIQVSSFKEDITVIWRDLGLLYAKKHK